MSLFMQRYLIIVLVILGILALMSLLYLVLGKRFTDKIVATNLMGSLGVNLIVILAVLLGADYILDISLVFALLAFLTVIVLCRFVQNYTLHRQSGESTAEAEQEVQE